MKKIRSLLLTFSLAAIAWSCGDAGFGFDVAAELPIIVSETVIPIPGTAAPIDIDPNISTFEYNLSDVDGFDDALNELRQNRDKVEIFLLAVAIEITGINDSGDTYDEAVPISEARMDFSLSGGDRSIEIDFPGDVLQNLSKTDLDISGVKDLFQNELENTERIGAGFVLDIGTFQTETTANELDFNVVVYFDVAIRVTDIND